MYRQKSEVRLLNGYRLILRPDYPRAMTSENWKGYVYEHIMVAEEMLGRPLLDGEVTHHLNGDRSDNRTGNLLVLSREQHTKLHTWLNAGAPFSKEEGCNGMNSGKSTVFSKEKEYCIFCGTVLQDKQKKFCSRSCESDHIRQDRWPTRDQLEIDVNSMSMLAVGRKYGVSDNAIRKRMKQLGITKTTLSQAGSTLPEGAETTGEVQSS